mgnify:CR=1 FL=1
MNLGKTPLSQGAWHVYSIVSARWMPFGVIPHDAKPDKVVIPVGFERKRRETGVTRLHIKAGLLDI